MPIQMLKNCQSVEDRRGLWIIPPVAVGLTKAPRTFKHESDHIRANTAWAALWPGAPVTSPPGCVPDPHK